MNSTEFQTSRIPKKGRWQVIVTTNDKHNWAPDLIDLVHNAYRQTNLGSFINSLRDVESSDWVAMDWDPDPDLDCTIFYRKARSNESFEGYKIQGIGHDGQQESKRKAIDRIKKLLTKPGWWIESSDALARTLGKLGIPPVTDEATLHALFPNSDLKLLDNRGTYVRKLYNNDKVTETVYGKPIISQHLSESTESMINTIMDNKTKKQYSDFIKWSKEQLKIQDPHPKITLSYDTKKAQEGHHTGVNNLTENTIWIYIGGRNMVDVFRTIYHELTHTRQNQLNMIGPDMSYPGSPVELLADMAAGKAIKIYGKLHPEIFQ
jgi:hypothetical protein